MCSEAGEANNIVPHARPAEPTKIVTRWSNETNSFVKEEVITAEYRQAEKEMAARQLEASGSFSDGDDEQDSDVGHSLLGLASKLIEFGYACCYHSELQHCCTLRGRVGPARAKLTPHGYAFVCPSHLICLQHYEHWGRPPHLQRVRQERQRSVGKVRRARGGGGGCWVRCWGGVLGSRCAQSSQATHLLRAACVRRGR